MIELIGKEIFDLARFAGFDIKKPSDDDLLEYEYTIKPCPKDGLTDGEHDTTPATHYKNIAYISDYPEEGSCGLGDAWHEPTTDK